MIEKYINETNESNLFTTPVTIKTKNNDIVKLDAIFQDTKPEGSNLGTVVNSHGAPGSHKDFKYINPKLEESGVRIVAVNFPGCGYTEYDERLQNDNYERIQFVQQIIDALNLSQKLIFIGHSRGSENSLKMAANNPEKSAGIISVNPIGIRPHRGTKPIFLFHLLAFLWRIQWLRFFSNWLMYQIYNKFARFKVNNGEICGVAMNLMAGLQYSDALPYIEKFNQSNAKAILLYAGKDWLIEPSVSREFRSCFKDNIEVISKHRGDDSETTENVVNELKNGRKTIGVFCQRDGHFLQKDRADLIAEAVLTILKNHSENSRQNA
uniref:AB hydrolase-1 domain-containing protein n=1 Tax=Panagrolaimus superbus TaxID=310955 RepID=A0A914Z8V9_9BILA